MATLLVIETARTLAQTRRCLAESHRCVALSRRLLNPAWGISGAADLVPHASIRERLERGTLAAASSLVGGGWGTGQPCIVCEQLIAPSEIASGSLQEDGSRVWTHLSCLRIWQAETAAHERRQIAKERRVHGELCALVRRGLANGTIEVLPHNQSRLDQGLVGSCSVCQQPISPDQIAYEVTGGVQQPPAYAHPTCHRVWWIESMARRKTQS